MTTPLRKLYRAIGKSVAQDKIHCRSLLAGLAKPAPEQPSLAQLFSESLEINSHFDGTRQPFLNSQAIAARKSLGPSSRGDNRIVYLIASNPKVDVIDGPRGYSFSYVSRQVPPFRQEGAGKPRSGAGGIDYTAKTSTSPVLGEIKRAGDKNPFYAFIQLLTYLSEMATENQVLRAAKHKEFGVSLKYPRPFDLHILLTDLNPRSDTIKLIEPTRQLVEDFKKRLGKKEAKLIGKVLCMQMNSAEFAASSTPTLNCDWVA